MGYIRAFFTLLAAVVWFVISLPCALVVLILNRISVKRADRFVYPFVRLGLRMVAGATGCRIAIRGRENLPEGAALYVSNHRSIFDVIFFLPLIHGTWSPVAKKELARIGILRFWMNRVHTLFLDRTDLRAGVKMVTDAVNLLKDGTSVYVCPEGTRNHTEGTLLDFKGGSFKIAIRAGAPVVPVTMIGTGDVFEDHFPKVRARNVTIVIDPPIETKDLSIAERRELHERVRALIQSHLDEAKEISA